MSFVWSPHVAVHRADCRRRPGLYGHHVRHRLLWRPSQRALAAACARLGVQPVAGGLLHQLDVLRRRGPGRRTALVVPADLPRADPVAGRRAVGPAKNGDDQQTGEHHLDRRLHRRTLWQIPVAGGGGGADLPGRRAALYRVAAQRHCARREPADRCWRRCHGHPGPGHGADRVAGAGAVHHRLRYPQPRRHGAPPRHGAGHRLRIIGEAVRVSRRRRLRDLRPVRRFRRPVRPGHACAAP
ncbi:hypothetical protein D9M71_126280 [compost metagenome]